MRSLVVVATTHRQGLNRFSQPSLLEARNLQDFLEQTGEYEKVSIYELEKSLGPIQQWGELQDDSR